jgi:adenosylcobyric acid synthase
MINKKAKSLCVLGTASDVGKSVVTTALGRILKRRGLDVAPYKAQNMSNNSYVTLDQGEMGRAQVVQAEACGVEPHVDMNPILLKPSTDKRAQLIVQGKAIRDVKAMEYFTGSQELVIKAAHESLNNLQEKYDFLVIEGAGSCAEVNLRDRDIVNFDIAHAADAPVLLVADIDRGGVFAQIIGTMELLPPQDKARVKGFIINRFRGDAKLFDDGVKFIEEKTGLPVLGVIPFYRHISIDPEDALELDVVLDPLKCDELSDKIQVAVIRLPHISNFTDVNVLRRDPAIELHYLSKVRDLDSYDLVILPGSKNTLFDLQWLHDLQWSDKIKAYANQGGYLTGICGGYQMLGRVVSDPQFVESELCEVKGLGLLDISTEMQDEKRLHLSEGRILENDLSVKGYEIHMGETTRAHQVKAFMEIVKRGDKRVRIHEGAISDNGRVWGTYFHGVFDNLEFRQSFLQEIQTHYRAPNRASENEFKETQYELLADHFEAHLDLVEFFKIHDYP